MTAKQPSGKARSRSNSSRPARALPRPGDPLVTKDGSIVRPDSRADLGMKDTKPWDVKPEDFRAQRRQNVKELQAEPRIVNACAVVLAYTMMGIGDREIESVMSITDDQLERIRQHEMYAALFIACQQELINVNSVSLQARIAGMAHLSLTNVIDLAQTATKEDTKLRANVDILDRAGTRVADQAERSKGQMTGLRVIVKKGDDTTIEITPEMGGDV